MSADPTCSHCRRSAPDADAAVPCADDLGRALAAERAAREVAERERDELRRCITDAAVALGVVRNTPPRAVVAEVEQVVERCNEWVTRAFEARRWLRDALREGLAACEGYRRTFAWTRARIVEVERMVDDLYRERDDWRDTAERQARMLAGAPSVEDGVSLLAMTVLDYAAQAPNHAEARGTWRGRRYALSVQWIDGKTPDEMIAEARAERDGLRTVLGDVYALVTGDTDGDPRPADAALRTLAAVAALHARCDDLADELSNIAEALGPTPTGSVVDAARGLVFRCQEAEHKRDEWEESAAIEKRDADRHRRAREVLEGAVRRERVARERVSETFNARIAAQDAAKRGAWGASARLYVARVQHAEALAEADAATAALDALLTGREVGDGQ